MEIEEHSTAILDVTNHLGKVDIFPGNKLEIFSFLLSSNKFDYHNSCNQLLESVIEFSLSRKYRETYKNESMKLSKEARTHCKDWKTGKNGVRKQHSQNELIAEQNACDLTPKTWITNDYKNN